MEAMKSNCAANSFTHVSFLVIINKPLLFLGVQSATPPKTPQEAKNDVSTAHAANEIDSRVWYMSLLSSLFLSHTRY